MYVIFYFDVCDMHRCNRIVGLVKIVDESFQEIIRLCLLYARHYKTPLCLVLNFTYIDPK